MNYLLIAQLPIYIVLLWIFTMYMCQSFPTLRGKRILLLIAHPDDEAMFFSPTLLWLTRPELGNKVIILCLSSGDADGLGHIRKAELGESAVQLGVRAASNVVVVEDDKLPDSMTTAWDSRYIANLLAKSFAPNISSTPATSAPTAGLDVLITFDAHGVSGHPNHISLYHGGVKFLQMLMQRHRGWDCPVKMYALRTTNVLRKYSSVLDVVPLVVSSLWRTKEKGETPTPLLIVSGPRDVRRAQRAMTTAHKSQMRWFRWGWIGISRYMAVNDLVKVKVT